jgi:hypothetical protein
LAWPVQFGQRLSLHLQLHLRVFLEHLRIALPEQLRDPLVRKTAGAEPRGVRRAEIVDAEVSDTCPLQLRMPNGFERLLIAVDVFIAWEQVLACLEIAS